MDKLLKILNELTALTIDKDLFAYEMPLDKSGAWLSESQTPTRFNAPNVTEYDLWVRGKDKTSTMANIDYLKNTIDSLSGSTGTCKLADGTTFKLEIPFTWDYVGKSEEGYFIFTTKLRLTL